MRRSTKCHAPMFSRLFLAPHEFGVLVARQRRRQRLDRERIELLDAHDRDVVDLALAPRMSADRNRPCRCTARRGAILSSGASLSISPMTRWNDVPGPISSSRDATSGAAQQRFRRHHDQRLAEIAPHLTAQRMEIIGGGGEIADLPIVLAAELQIALEPRRGMLRPLALIAVRQQQHRRPTCAAISPRPRR